jgi:hypothetical protein
MYGFGYVILECSAFTHHYYSNPELCRYLNGHVYLLAGRIPIDTHNNNFP